MPPDDPEWSPFLECTFLSVLESADEGIIAFDRDGRCRMIGRRAGELFGIEPAALVGQTRVEVLRKLSASCEEPEAFLQSVAANDLLEPPKVVAEVNLRRPRPRTVVWATFPILNDGAAWGRLALVRDVTRERSAERAQKQLQARLAEMTPIDPLTRLLNQKRFREELDREHGRSSRCWDSYAVLRFDVDDMRDLNEEFGVPIGDSVLEQVADRLKAGRREYDVLARLEGDEFVLLLPGADAVAARTVAQRMLGSIAKHGFQLADRRRITLTAGGCVWVPPSGESGEEILRRAGLAAQRARTMGKGQMVIDVGSAAASTPPPPATST